MKSLTVDGRSCDLNKYSDPVWKGQADYELVTPDGFVFGGTGTHYLLNTSLSSIKQQAKTETLVACDDGECDVCNH